MNEPEESAEAMFVRKLGVTPDIARLLASTGMTSLEEVAYVPLAEMREIKAFDDTQIQVLQRKAKKCLLNEALGGEPLPPGPWE